MIIIEWGWLQEVVGRRDFCSFPFLFKCKYLVSQLLFLNSRAFVFVWIIHATSDNKSEAFNLAVNLKKCSVHWGTGPVSATVCSVSEGVCLCTRRARCPAGTYRGPPGWHWAMKEAEFPGVILFCCLLQTMKIANVKNMKNNSWNSLVILSHIEISPAKVEN